MKKLIFDSHFQTNKQKQKTKTKKNKNFIQNYRRIPVPRPVPTAAMMSFKDKIYHTTN